jgi:hypothetical protein
LNLPIGLRPDFVQVGLQLRLGLFLKRRPLLDLLLDWLFLITTGDEQSNGDYGKCATHGTSGKSTAVTANVVH